MMNITAEEFDRIFDEGEEDILDYMDLSNTRRPNMEVAEDEARKVNITLPQWLINRLDREASHLAISRQAVIATWLADTAERKGNVRYAYMHNA